MVSFFSLFAGLSLVAGALSAPVGVLKSPRSAAPSSTATQEKSYHYWWTDSGRDVNFTSFDGGSYSIEWSNGANFIGGKGWNPGGRKNVKYAGTYSPNGNSYLALYGWTTSPLVEYYVVESFGDNDPSTDKEKKGEVTSDNGTYDIYVSSRKNVSSSEQTVKQYWSVRREKHVNGTITTGNHFDAWARAGLELGSFEYMIMATEGHLSSGSASITVGVDESPSSDGGDSDPAQVRAKVRVLVKVRALVKDQDQDQGLGMVKAQDLVPVRVQVQVLDPVKVLVPELVPALDKVPALVQDLALALALALAPAPAPAPAQVKDLDQVKGQDLVKTLAQDLTALDQVLSVAQALTVTRDLAQSQSQILVKVKVKTVAQAPPQSQSQTQALVRDLIPAQALAKARAPVKDLTQVLPPAWDQILSAGRAQIVIQDLFQSQFQTLALALALALVKGQDLARAQYLILARAQPRARDQILNVARARIVTQALEQAPVKVLVKFLPQAQVLPRDRDQTLSAARDLIATQAQVKYPVLVQALGRVLEKALEQALVGGRAQSQSQSQSQTQDLARALLQDQDQTPNVVQGRTATQALGEDPEQDLVKVLEQALVEALVQSQSQTLE
ncbi:Endo-1,4-beta-xylanase [Fusarium keratoplasticum]|nr:Endo-1,4-beta-xylanase [Fusarium keratoplasticum]